MTRPRDSQRGAVYAWERKVAQEYPSLRVALTLPGCADLVRRVWHDYRPGKPMPDIRDGRGRRNAAGSPRAIWLPVWARQPYIVLHEVAHSLAPESPWHGRVFARLLVDLLVRYGDVPRDVVLRAGRTQKPRRVWFAKVAACPRPASRNLRAWHAEHERLRRIEREARLALEAHALTRPKE